MSGDMAPELQVRVEWVTVDGAEGQVLEERQLVVIREVLAWARRGKASAPGAGQRKPPKLEVA